MDFCLWETYISSLHQSLLRDEEPDLSWFAPDRPKEGIRKAWDVWMHSPLILQQEAIQDWFASRPLPESLRWFVLLQHRLARVEEDEAATVFLSAAQEGYAVLLAIHALTPEELQAMYFSPFIDLTK